MYLRWPDVRLVFIRTDGVLARITRWVTRSPANHMYLEIPVWGRRMVCEASVDGEVRIVPNVPKGSRLIVSYRCHFDTTPGIYALMELLGRPYDYWGGVGIAIVRLAWRWFRLKLKHWRWSTSAIKCSELAVMFLQASQIRTGGLDMELSAPADVLAWCHGRPGWFERVQGAPPNLASWESKQ